MSLINTQSTNGYLEAVGGDGVAVSKQIVQQTGANISIATVADTLVTNTAITNGTALVIEKLDGTFHNIIAAGVTGIGPYTMNTSTVTLGEVPSKVYLKSTFESDFAAIRNISMDLEFGNIADGSTNINLLKTRIPVVNGNKLIIVKNDNSINEVIAGNITVDNSTRLAGGSITSGSESADSFPLGFASSDLSFSPDETKVFMMDITSGVMKRYDLTTAGDIKTAVFFGQSPTVGTSMNGCYVKPDGTKLYSIYNATIYEYTMSPAWDIRTLTQTDSGTMPFSFGSSGASGINFKEDGTKLIIGGYNTGNIRECSLGTAWDIKTLTLINSFTLANPTTYSAAITSDGFKVITGNYASGSVTLTEYNMTEAWNVGTMSLGNSFLIGTSYDYLRGLFIKQDGNSIYCCGTSNLTGNRSLFKYDFIDSLNTQIITLYVIDTTAITQGEIPSRVYKLNDGLQFNAIAPANPVDSFTVVGNLRTTRTYDDVFISGRTIETTVNLSQGNKMTRLSASVDTQL